MSGVPGDEYSSVTIGNGVGVDAYEEGGEWNRSGR